MCSTSSNVPDPEQAGIAIALRMGSGKTFSNASEPVDAAAFFRKFLNIHQRERRGMNASGKSQPAREAFHQLRFARAQIARQRDHQSAFCRAPPGFAQRFGFRDAMRNARSHGD